MNSTCMSGFECTRCKKLFSLQHNLNAHLRKYHGVLESSILRLRSIPYTCSFDDCKTTKPAFFNIQIYRNHLEDRHNVYGASLYTEKIFRSYEDFKAWKSSEEKRECSQFVQHCGSKLGANRIQTIYYYCNRSGFCPATSSRKRRRKSQGSCKIENKCPAAMVLIHRNSLFKVKYYQVHFGHAKSTDHLRIDILDKQFIAEKLAEGFSKNDILKHIKNQNCKREKSNFITKNDIDNIKRSKLGELAQNHFDGIVLANACVKLDEITWQITVPDSVSDNYLIKKNNTHKCTSACSSFCHQCQAFTCSLVCSCGNYKNTSCKHIHAVLIMELPLLGKNSLELENLKKSERIIKSINNTDKSIIDCNVFNKDNCCMNNNKTQSNHLNDGLLNFKTPQPNTQLFILRQPNQVELKPIVIFNSNIGDGSSHNTPTTSGKQTASYVSQIMSTPNLNSLVVNEDNLLIYKDSNYHDKQIQQTKLSNIQHIIHGICNLCESKNDFADDVLDKVIEKLKAAKDLLENPPSSSFAKNIVTNTPNNSFPKTFFIKSSIKLAPNVVSIKAQEESHTLTSFLNLISSHREKNDVNQI